MKMKTKIVFFLATLNGGGAERVTITLMRQLDPQKFEIFLILVSKEGPLLAQVPKNVTIINLKSKRTLFSVFSLRRNLKKIRADIIYSTLFRTHIAIDLALINLQKKPKTIFISPSSPKLLFSRKEISAAMKYFIDRAYRRADIVLAQTPEMKDEISKYHKIDSHKITVFLNPVDTKMIDEKIKKTKNLFNPNVINIVAAGRLSDVKGFDILLYAFRKVLDKDSTFYLNIIGRDAGEEQNLKDLAKKLLIEDKVKFWGYQENPFQFFFFSDLFILSSRREGLPNAVLENIYLKKPIIATRCIPYMSELIDDSSGFLVDVEDSQALSDAILKYKRMNVNDYNYMDKLVDINNFFTKV